MCCEAQHLVLDILFFSKDQFDHHFQVYSLKFIPDPLLEHIIFQTQVNYNLDIKKLQARIFDIVLNENYSRAQPTKPTYLGGELI